MVWHVLWNWHRFSRHRNSITSQVWTHAVSLLEIVSLIQHTPGQFVSSPVIQTILGLFSFIQRGYILVFSGTAVLIQDTSQCFREQEYLSSVRFSVCRNSSTYPEYVLVLSRTAVFIQDTSQYSPVLQCLSSIRLSVFGNSSAYPGYVLVFSRIAILIQDTQGYSSCLQERQSYTLLEGPRTWGECQFPFITFTMKPFGRGLFTFCNESHFNFPFQKFLKMY